MKSSNNFGIARFGIVAAGVLTLLAGGGRPAPAQVPPTARPVPAALAEWTPPGARVPASAQVQGRYYEGTMVSSAPYAQVLKFYTDKAGYPAEAGTGPSPAVASLSARPVYAHYMATPAGRSMYYAMPIGDLHTQKADLVVVTASAVCTVSLTHDAGATTTDIIVRLVPQQYAPGTQAAAKPQVKATP